MTVLPDDACATSIEPVGQALSTVALPSSAYDCVRLLIALRMFTQRHLGWLAGHARREVLLRFSSRALKLSPDGPDASRRDALCRFSTGPASMSQEQESPSQLSGVFGPTLILAIGGLVAYFTIEPSLQSQRPDLAKRRLVPPPPSAKDLNAVHS